MSNKINSIFYFPESLTFESYLSQLNSGSIAQRTIVFAEAQQAIYKNGVQYGISDIEKLKELIKEVLKDPTIIKQIEQIFNNSEDPDLINKIKEIIDDYLKNDPTISNSLPIASKTKRGVIKVGNGLQMSGTDSDTMNVDFTGVEGIPGLDGLVKTIIKTEPSVRASKTEYGIVKIGQGINVTNGVISIDGSTGDPTYVENDYDDQWIHDEFARIKSDGQSSEYVTDASVNNYTLKLTKKNGNVVIYEGDGSGASTLAELDDVQISGLANNQSLIYSSSINKWINGSAVITPGEPGEGGTTYIENDYDDSWIRAKFSTLENNVDRVENSIRTDLANLDSHIVDKFKQSVQTFEMLVGMYPDGGTYFASGLNDERNAWAQTLGLITPIGNGTYKVGWSDLTQSYNSIRADVTAIQGQLGSGNNNVNYEMLASGLYAYIEDNYATSGLESTWGKFMKLTNDDIVRLEWMSSGVQSYASDSQSFAKLMAAAQEYDEEGKDLLQEAWSGVNAIVEKDQYGRYVATSYLSTLVDDSISGVFTENSSNSAVAQLYSRISSVESDTSAVSGLITDVTKLKNGDYMTSAILASKIGGMTDADKLTAFAGLATQASLTSAETALTTELNGVKSSISNVVKHDADNKITSEIILDADQIQINGDTFIRNLTANSAFIAALQTIDLGASRSLICGDVGSFGIAITSSSDHLSGGNAHLLGGLLVDTPHGKDIEDASLSVWYGTSGAQMMFDANDCSTLLSGDGLWIMPESGLVPKTTEAYVSLKPTGMYMKSDDDISSGNAAQYSAVYGITGMEVGTVFYTQVGSGEIFVTDSPTSNGRTFETYVKYNSVSVKNLETNAETIFEAGKITLKDGNGHTKEITATN